MRISKHNSNLTQSKVNYILTDLLGVRSPSQWTIMNEEGNIFYNKCKDVAGSPNFAFYNEKTLETLVLNYFSRIRTQEIYPVEYNLAFIHAQLALDTIQKYYISEAEFVTSYLVYADYKKFKITPPKYYGIYLRNAAISLCEIKNIPCVDARELAHYMTQKKLFLVRKDTDKQVYLENDEPFPLEEYFQREMVMGCKLSYRMKLRYLLG